MIENLFNFLFIFEIQDQFKMSPHTSIPVDTVKTLAGNAPSGPATPPLQQSGTIMFLRHLSGQERETSQVEMDHSYNRPWNQHPDSHVRSRPARFLFMNDFPRHFRRRADRLQPPYGFQLDVTSASIEERQMNPFATEASQLGLRAGTPDPQPMSSTISQLATTPLPLLMPTPTPPNELEETDPPAVPDRLGWNSTLQNLWTEMIQILDADRLARLSLLSTRNEIIIRKNLQDKTCAKLRQLFSARAHWDFAILGSLHAALIETLPPSYAITYVEAIQQLRQRIPTLVDRLLAAVKLKGPHAHLKLNTRQQVTPDPIQIILNNYKPKRLAGSPLFLIVPNGPLIAHQLTSQRMKHWHNIFGSLGKVITVNTSYNNDASLRALNCLKEIRRAVREKVNECKGSFNEARPLILVGFGHSSLIAASCALENAASVTATICLGFPLTGINGFRGVSRFTRER